MKTTNLKKDLKTGLAACAKKGWAHKGKSIRKSFIFKDFDDAFSFMTRCALAIVKLDHHPVWLQNYNKVYIELTTHDTGGVSGKDLALATIMDKIATVFSGKKVSG